VEQVAKVLLVPRVQLVPVLRVPLVLKVLKEYLARRVPKARLRGYRVLLVPKVLQAAKEQPALLLKEHKAQLEQALKELPVHRERLVPKVTLEPLKGRQVHKVLLELRVIRE
jgi:hypothetical protein